MKFPRLQMLRTLRSKIMALSCGVALVASLAVGGLNAVRAAETVRSRAAQTLHADADLIMTRVERGFGDIRNDARIVAVIPSVLGIAGEQTTEMPELVETAMDKQRRASLAASFTTIMRARPEYTQFRLIGLADGGREVVRVNRVGDELVTVAEATLQKKGEEPYYRAGSMLSPEGVAFSEVNYNHEYGVQDGTGTPTIRAIVPVFDSRGQRFGMIVINANFASLIGYARVGLGADHDLWVETDTGANIHFDERATSADAALFVPADGNRPAALANDPVVEEHSLIEVGDRFYARKRHYMVSESAGLALNIALGVDRGALLPVANDTWTMSLVFAFFLMVASLLAAGWAAGVLTRPLRDMTALIRSSNARRAVQDLPVDSTDELGELARAFKQMVNGIQDVETKTRTVIESVVDGLMVIDEEGLIDVFNPACERIFGVRAEHVIGENVTMLLSPDARQLYKNDFSKFIGSAHEIQGQRRDGETFPADLSISEMVLDGHLMYCAVVRDITDRKQVENLKDEFVSTVNHELRTPLTAIYGALDLLPHVAAKELGEKGLRLVQLAHEGCERLSHLVNDILDQEKIAAGKMDYRFEVMNFGGLVQEIVDRNEQVADLHGVTFEARIDVADVDVKVDPSRFSQALVNLLSNAAKYSPRGSRVRIAAEQLDDSSVRVSVVDSGPGISKKFQERIFERFAQADATTTRKVAGTGLGLNITKTLIEAFGGTVGFETSDGQGTTFYFVLPVYDEIYDEVELCQAS